MEYTGIIDQGSPSLCRGKDVEIIEKVDHPSHYQGSIECIDAMEAAFGKEAVAIFCKLNAFKYLWRAGKKDSNSEKQDLEKARWYTKKAIELTPEDSFNEAAVGTHIGKL